MRNFLLIALLALCTVGMLLDGALVSALAGGVPTAVYQDSSRAYRKNKGLPLDAGQRGSQAARVRTELSQGQGLVPQAAQGAGPALQLQTPDGWRLRVREAAVVQGTTVLLGEIADPLGDIPPAVWTRLAAQPLWPAPEETGKPLQINKTRLRQALRDVLGETAERCIIAGSLAIQRGGLVLQEADLRKYVVSYLTPQMQALPGTADISDFRLPPYIFLSHPQQRVGLETGKVVPGRVTLRFVVQEPDGTVVRRVAGTIFLNMWMDAPAAARPLLKGEPLRQEDVTFIRMNAAQLKNMPWDGRGGPWQMARTVAAGEPIFQSDLTGQCLVRKGNIVELLYQKGNLTLSVQVEIMADGGPGETIPVRNLQSKKQVYATVRDGKTVIAQ